MPGHNYLVVFHCVSFPIGSVFRFKVSSLNVLSSAGTWGNLHHSLTIIEQIYSFFHNHAKESEIILHCTFILPVWCTSFLPKPPAFACKTR